MTDAKKSNLVLRTEKYKNGLIFLPPKKPQPIAKQNKKTPNKPKLVLFQ